MNSRVVIIFISVLFSLAASIDLAAQPLASLSGIVRDGKTGLPIEGVSIAVKGTTKGASTDTSGVFKISNLPKGETTVIASFVGYATQEVYVKLDEGENRMEIIIQAQSTELSPVTILSESEMEADTKNLLNNIMPVTIVTAKQIENRAGNLNEILARQAGVQIRLSGGLGSESRISVRGLEGKRVQVFLDGNPLNSPDGSLGINDLPVQIIERIEIYKGSVPAYLGGDGLGSAVNVVFRHRDISYVDASYLRQSFNTQIASLILKKTFDKQGIEIGAGIFDTRTDNDYTMPSPYQPGLKIKRDHDRYHSLLAGGSIRFHKWWFDEVEVEGAFIKNNREIQGIQKNIQHVESRSDAGALMLNLKKKSFVHDKLGLKYNLMFARFNVTFVDTSSYHYNWDGSRYPSSLGQGELGIGPNFAINLQKDLRQRINVDYRLDKYTNINVNNTSRYATLEPNDSLGNAHAGKNLFNYPGTIKNTITGLTVERNLFKGKLLASSAVKHFYNVVDGYNTSIYLTNETPDKLHTVTTAVGYNLGVRYNFTTALLMKVSYEKGIRLPNNTELFGDGVLITPSTSLQPEMAHNFNAGIMYDQTNVKGSRLQWEVTGFYMGVDNLIQLSGNGLTLGYVNYARASIAGADFEVKYDLTKNIFASVNGTFQQLTDKNRLIPGTDVRNPTYNLTIPNTPKLFFNWSLEFHKAGLFGTHSKTRVMYDGAFVDRFDYGFNISVYDNFSIPAYLTHTLSVEQSFNDGRYIVTGEVNNLSDEIVINNFNQPLPGRTFRIKLRYLLLGKTGKHGS